MSATEFEPVLPANTLRAGIYPLTKDGKIYAFIEDIERLVTQPFSGEDAYKQAKQWIKDNL